MSSRAGRVLGDWTLTYVGWDAEAQPLREALTTLGNGVFATRGAAEEESAGGGHYPGTYFAGAYDRVVSRVQGRDIEHEDLVNWPNWLPLRFRARGGEWLRIDDEHVLDYRKELDLRRGVLSRRVRLVDADGREFLLESRRIVHMSRPHLAAIEWRLTPVDWSGTIEISSMLDGDVENAGVARYRELSGRHLDIIDGGSNADDSIYLVARTRQSRVVLAEVARTRIVSGTEAASPRRVELDSARVEHRFEVSCSAGRPLTVEKVVALHSSRDFAISEPLTSAQQVARRAPGFDTLAAEHERAWACLWKRADVSVRCRPSVQFAQATLRLHVFHLLQTASPCSIGHDVGIPARGWHGEAYRGHIFWDELFAFPFLNFSLPDVARSLLFYRHRRLDEARWAAAERGLDGALFPWQSGSDGREESQSYHLNPESGRWLPDRTHLQRHVNAAIAYNVWHYYQATGDVEFLSDYGAEMLLATGKLFASLVSYDDERERYVLRGVVGPDEFHTHYPDSDEPGIDNNAYTNIMAVWVLSTIPDALDVLGCSRRQELLEQVAVTGDDLERWEHIGRRMYVPFHGPIISQFDGWEQLRELDWEGMRQRHGNIQRLDRLLEAEGDDVNRYQACKQADVLMLFYLFSADRLIELFRRLDYPLDTERIRETVDYYLSRTSHGSTLSHVVHSWVMARTDRMKSMDLFLDALASDIDDIQGGTTAEGIHLGAMAGSVDLVQRCYTGMYLRDGVLWLEPQLPEPIECLAFSLRYSGHWIRIELTHRELSVSLARGWAGTACIGVAGRAYELCEGQRRRFVFDARSHLVREATP